MPEISQIKPQKNQKGVNIYVDGKFAMGVGLEDFIKLGLRVGQEMTLKDITNLTKKVKYQRFLGRLLKFASVRPRSLKEIKDWLVKNEAPSKWHTKLVDKLKEYDLADDAAFARWWVEQRVQFKNKSITELVFELKQKGISRDLCRQILSEIDINEDRSAKTLLEKNAHRWSRFDVHTAKVKKTAFLARKGFRWETIRKLLPIDRF